MIKNSGKYGMGTLSLHTAEGDHPFHSHAAPIYPTSTFSFPDVATGQAIWRGEQPGHIYTRLTNPNFDQLSEKITTLEAFDLMKQYPGMPLGEIAAGLVFASGMAAITTTLLTCLKNGDTIIAQEQLYGATYTFMKDIATKYGIHPVFIHDPIPENWLEAFKTSSECKDRLHGNTLKPGNGSRGSERGDRDSSFFRGAGDRGQYLRVALLPAAFDPGSGYGAPFDNKIPFRSWAGDWRCGG